MLKISAEEEDVVDDDDEDVDDEPVDNMTSISSMLFNN